jgi:hypothetical protein
VQNCLWESTVINRTGSRFQVFFYSSLQTEYPIGCGPITTSTTSSTRNLAVCISMLINRWFATFLREKCQEIAFSIGDNIVCQRPIRPCKWRCIFQNAPVLIQISGDRRIHQHGCVKINLLVNVNSNIWTDLHGLCTNVS